MTHHETPGSENDSGRIDLSDYLKDSMITPEEALKLKSDYMIYGEQIHNESGNNLGALNDELSNGLQSVISIPSNEVIEAEAFFETPKLGDAYEGSEREKYNEGILSMTLDTEASIYGISLNTRQSFPDFISQGNGGNVMISPMREEGTWKLTGLEIRTSNDNLVPHGKDDGFTFGLYANIDYTREHQENFTLSGGLESYTDNPLFIQQDDGRIGNNPWNISRRVDRGYIQGVYSNSLQIGENTALTLNRGLGVGFTGDLGGEQIQNNWHESNLGRKTMSTGNEYTVHAPYEKGDSTYVYGVLGVEGRYNLTNSIYVNGGVQGKIPIYGEGPTILEGNIGVGFDTKYVDAEVGLEYYSHTGDPSSLINDFYDGRDALSPYLEVSVGNNNRGPEIFGRFSGKQRGQGSVGVRWNF